MSDNHFDTAKASRLDSHGRIIELRIPELLADIGGVAEGMTCVDLGSGTGTFTLPLVNAVGEAGKVFAIDDSATMMTILATKSPPENVIPIRADFADTGLDDCIADFCLAAFILHETKDAQRVIDEAYRLLKPGGRFLVMEWRPEQDSPGPPQRIRVKPGCLIEMFFDSGFKNFYHREWTEKHYFACADR